MTTLTITRVLPGHARTTRTVEVGDVVSEGYGTLDVFARIVTDLHRFYYNGYCNVTVTFADRETKTYYDGTRWPLVEVA